jgi:hypothetical protein
MAHKITYRELLAVEFRVLPFHRFVKDRIYWGWCSLWFAVLPPLAALTWVPFMAGCRGYFELRDGAEYPAIGRWCSQHWVRWRNRTYPHHRSAS